MDRKIKRLYFRYGDKFHLVYQCTKRQLWLLILGDDESVKEGEVVAIDVDAENTIKRLECIGKSQNHVDGREIKRN